MAEKKPIRGWKKKPAKKTPKDSQGKRGLGVFLPLAAIVLLAPAAAWLTLWIVSHGAKKRLDSPPVARAPAEHTPEAEVRAKPKEESGKPDHDLDVPLSRDTIRLMPLDSKKYPGKLAILAVNGDALGEAKPETMRVNVANTGGSRLALVRLTLRGDGAEVIERVNLNRIRLLDAAESAVASKTLGELEGSDIKKRLGAELVESFNDIMGSGTIYAVNVDLDLRDQ